VVQGWVAVQKPSESNLDWWKAGGRAKISLGIEKIGISKRQFWSVFLNGIN
jgi:hypothetical protein